MTPRPGDIILASASASRRRLLEAAGVGFRAIPSGVDEDTIKRGHGGSFDDLALDLAIAKALAVAGRNPGALVIGADQVLVLEDAVVDKPTSIEDARRQLLRLRGRPHRLVTAIACAKGPDVLWSHVESPQLAMRMVSSDWIEAYLEAEGRAVTETVGGYRIEGAGIQLFESIDGDYFAILGLPLLPLLGFLRAEGAVAT